jgi:pullulanase
MPEKYNFDSSSFDRRLCYAGPDLGASYRARETRFRVWAPTAGRVDLLLYKEGTGGECFENLSMKPGAGGTWMATLPGNWKGVFYAYRVRVGQRLQPEAVDPYARAVGVNGLRAMVVDLRDTDPPGWRKDRRPPFTQPTDAVIYEAHVRDMTIDRASGAKLRGKFLGLAERGTRGPGRVRTGLDHLVELGVTHVHLLPVFDFGSIDEADARRRQYNWGYDPVNYNVPEGSYATDARDGVTRIREFKQLVKALHDRGIRVVMDVVYNHTFKSEDSSFNHLVPGYYYRRDARGNFTNGSGCGNETASERAMVRKLMVDSVDYWAREYHVDGFRFDLMGVHDLGTMRAIRRALDQVDRSIIVYGEGWTGGDSPLADARRAAKTNVRHLRGVAAFSDNIRDAIKGEVWDHKATGFVGGRAGLEETVKAGVVASTRNPGVRYPVGKDWHGPWAVEPWRCVTYASCHDNHTLWDKLCLAHPGVPEAERIGMDLLAAAIVFTSQGIAFLHAGEEFLRTKKGVENSYNQPDEINRIDWRRKGRYAVVFRYYRGLIALRRAHPAFRMTRSADIRRHLRFLDPPCPGVVAFAIEGHANGDPTARIAVVYNASAKPCDVLLPAHGWEVLVEGRRAGIRALRRFRGDTIRVAALSCAVVRAANG